MSARFTNCSYRGRRRLLRALVASSWVAAGCAQVLGLTENIDCVAGSPKEGCTAMAVGPLEPISCDAYCERVQSLCNENDTQVYATQDECEALCPKMAEDTLPCRFHALDPYAPGTGAPSRACSVAGPGAGGDGDPNAKPANCESLCEAYCRLMDRVCGETSLSTVAGEPDPKGPFASNHDDCVQICSREVDHQQGYIRSRFQEANEVLCRIYHVSLAVTTGNTMVHCEHAAGRAANGTQPCAKQP